MFDKKSSDKSKPASSVLEASVRDMPATSVTSPARTCAMIGSTIVVKGEVRGGENLIVDGTVEGSIELSNHELSIGQSGRVNANITAKSVRIDGEVQGDITGHEKVTISKSGNVQGNIVAPRVTLEDGAKFKGSIDMDPGEKVAAAKSKQAESLVPKPVETKSDSAAGTSTVSSTH
ncbi:polymer-forming cytoskeletal protein [Porticoccaceae bacterium LTM1]|nr:polymer-forming cytoskeletal protein [Porticoccaceae bacterium LTM1]